jgi:TPP-dependent pyruvate/acetoin dehydrogenase alpha subunit
LQRALKEEQQPEWAEYSPEAALSQEREDEQRERETARLRSDLDEAHREAIEAAQDSPPPKTVSCYRDIYGDWPRGWPPSVEL